MVEFRISNDTQAYDEYIRKHPYGDLLQTSGWAKVKEGDWTAKRIVMTENGVVRGTAQLLYRRLIGPYKLCYVSRGPVVDYRRLQDLDHMMACIRRMAKKDGAVVIKFDPKLERDAGQEVYHHLSAKGYRHAGFHLDMREIQPRFNMILPIDASEEEILQRYSETVRRQLKKLNPALYEVQEVGDDWSDFCRLMEETAKRDRIMVRDEAYFRRMTEIYRATDEASAAVIYLKTEEAIREAEKKKKNMLSEQKGVEKKINRTTDPEKRARMEESLENLKLRVAELEEEIRIFTEGGRTRIPLACSLVLQCGKHAYYLYGGSSDSFRKYDGVAALLDRNIKAAKEAGATRFDFGGVSGRTDWEEDERYGGLYLFKRAWGTDMVEYIGEFEWPVRKILNGLLNRAIAIRKKRLRKRTQE